MRRSAAHQHGIALVYALLVLAVTVSMVMPRVTGERLAIARTANLVDQAQAHALARGIELWAATVLTADLRASPVDHMGEPWAKPLAGLTAGRAVLSGRLSDARARFNLNALVDAQGRLNVVHIARFRRLLVLLDLPAELTDAVIDWIDGDDVARLPEGVESDYYARLDPAYRAANRPLTSVSELRLVAGFTPEIYARLAPHVIALDDAPELNVNTASETVLMSLSDTADRQALGVFLRGRRAEPVKGLADLGRWAFFGAEGLEVQGLDVVSDWFLLEAAIGLPRAEVTHRALLRRSNRDVRVVRRWSDGE